MTVTRTLLVAGATAAAASALATSAQAAATWRLAQPAAPPPPTGVAPAPYPVPLGAIGDIAFEAPNRGLLATQGPESDISGQSGVVKEGLYRWDGTAWTPFSSVCSGRYLGPTAAPSIVWAGPREFWMIASPRRENRGTTGVELGPVTLCHFRNGEFVASYATAVTDPNPYLAMYGGACVTSDDCWFAGQALPGKAGAFHLHWNGSVVTIVNGPQGREVRDVEPFRGKAYEVTTQADPDTGDVPLLSFDEPSAHLIHVLTDADGSPAIDNDPFVAKAAGDLSNIDPDTYEPGTPDPYASELDALSADGDDVLWAGGGQSDTGPNVGLLDPSAMRGPLLAAKIGDTPFKEVPLTDPRLAQPGYRIVDIAAVPGDRTAWLAIIDLSGQTKGALVAHVALDGTVLAFDRLPLADDPDPNTIGSGTGSAGRIACTGVDECWLTTTTGWLYRLSDPASPPLAQDDDPYMNTVISTRPADATSIVDLSDTIPDDNSGADLQPQLPVQTESTPVEEPTVKIPPRAKRVKVKVIGRSRIQISFTLTKRARVKLKLLHGKTVVAQSKRATLAPGVKRFTFAVSAKRWPTNIKLDVTQP